MHTFAVPVEGAGQDSLLWTLLQDGYHEVSQHNTVRPGRQQQLRRCLLPHFFAVCHIPCNGKHEACVGEKP